MKFCLLLVFVFKIAAFPAINDRFVFPDELETIKNNEIDLNTDNLENRFNDDAGDLELDFSSLLNDSNILKSDNDTSEFLYDDQTSEKPQYGDLFQGDIELMPEQVKLLNSTGEEIDLSDRTGLISTIYRWPKNRIGKVLVPYVISSNDYCKYVRIRLP